MAHRGDSVNAPENTMASFQKAMDVGADGIELDVHMSKDDHLVVIHDERVDRTTDGTGYVRDYTLKELKELDAGIKFSPKFAGEKIPTLEEVLELIDNKNILLNIEVKSGVVNYPGIEKKLVETVRKYDIAERVILSSFNYNSIRGIKRFDCELKVGLLYEYALTKPWYIARRMGVYSLHPYYFNITQELVSSCKKYDIKLFPWTVDKKEDMRKMIEIGVDGIITDNPGLLIEVRDKGRGNDEL
ncbi:glycerophosphodiester phosphodiesterase [Caldanaerobius polysaccharolyticus]